MALRAVVALPSLTAQSLSRHSDDAQARHCHTIAHVQARAHSRDTTPSVPSTPSARSRRGSGLLFSISSLTLPFSLPVAVLADEIIAEPDVSAPSVPDLSLPSISDALSLYSDSTQALVNTVSEPSFDPTFIAVGAAALLVPVSLFFLFKKGYAGDLSPSDALSYLQEDSSAFLIDVRSKKERGADGAPSLKSTGKKALTVTYVVEGEDGELMADEDFVEKVIASKGVSLESPLLLLDSVGPLAVEAAKALTKAKFQKVYAVRGGAIAWKESGLTWVKPSSFKLDLGVIKDAITSTVEDNKALLPASLGVAAAAGASVVLLSEVEVALQVLGSAALLQLLVKRFLFAEDRNKTIAEIKTFLDTKVAPQSLADDIKEIGSALLPNEKEVTEKELSDARELIDALEQAVELPAASAATSASGEGASSQSDSAAASLSESESKYPDLKPPSSPMPSPP
eukprot:TRINITY_DN3106_c0_g1_i8.p1 TRINITY_DN3106_c0_g1~~TRINITY_DN3106_c0_g1_i8.p1  ORF type:complete len:488 (+),score=88.79 TRINITY_DN3106_c0_g1_i8:100-1464(+)